MKQEEIDRKVKEEEVKRQQEEDQIMVEEQGIKGICLIINMGGALRNEVFTEGEDNPNVESLVDIAEDKDQHMLEYDLNVECQQTTTDNN